ncbi:MAG: hypothetical protein ACRD0B_06900, partial [Acidimicrobiales bacterium]
RIVYDGLSTGASDDLQRNTELARKMVREWGMSERIGPMAWGSQGTVFLGEDLMHSRDYSEDTSRVVDQEIERILREAEDYAERMLREHHAGLESVARALLERETIDGREIARLVDTAYGRAVHGEVATADDGAPRYATALVGGGEVPAVGAGAAALPGTGPPAVLGSGPVPVGGSPPGPPSVPPRAAPGPQVPPTPPPPGATRNGSAGPP